MKRMGFKVPATISLGCILIIIASLAISLGVNAVITLGVHWILPQFDYWKEFVAVYIIAFLLTSVFGGHK